MVGTPKAFYKTQFFACPVKNTIIASLQKKNSTKRGYDSRAHDGMSSMGK
jgi:hypothetical protein